MSERDFWERMNAAADRAEDKARAEKAYTRMRKAGVSEETIEHSRRLASVLEAAAASPNTITPEAISFALDVARDATDRESARILRELGADPETGEVPLYTDDDGPEVVSSSLGAWIGWPEKAPGMGRGR